MNMMASSVPDHVFNCTKSPTNTHEVSSTVKAIHQTRSMVIMIDLYLCKRLQDTKIEEDEDARAHVIRLLDLREQLASTGKNIDDDESVSILLGSLPPSYEPIINTINAVVDQMSISVTLSCPTCHRRV